MKNNGLMIGAGVVVILAIIGAVFLISTSSIPVATTTVSQATTSAPATAQGYSYGKSYSAPVMITDPAQVPNGTSALVFTYSNVQLNTTGPSGPQWVNATGTGSVNLINVINKTQVLAYVNISANTTISQVRMLVTSVQITLNGNTTGVPVSKPQLTLTLSGNTKAVAGSGVLIDYTPTVSPAFNGNTTTYVRVPSGKAFITGNINGSASTNVGLVFPITAAAKASLAAVTTNLTITNASVWASGNVTWVSVTVKNNGNQSVTLSNLVLYGQQNVNATAALTAATGSNNTSFIDQSIVHGAPIGRNVHANIAALVTVGVGIKYYAMQNFAAGSGGSLTLVTSLASSNTSGTALAPGATATLTYNATALYNSGMFQTTPKTGSQYRIYVGTKNGMSASTTVTAIAYTKKTYGSGASVAGSGKYNVSATGNYAGTGATGGAGVSPSGEWT